MIILVNSVKVDETMKMEYISNPKRIGFKAHARYEEYMSCESIEEYMEMCDVRYARPDLRYDEEHGFLRIYDADGELLNPITE